MSGQNATNSTPSFPGAQQPLSGNYNAQYAQYYAGASASNPGGYGAAHYNAYGQAYGGQPQQPPSSQAQPQSGNEKK